MQRKFILNLILLIGLNLLIKPFWILGIDRTVQNMVDASTYGMYFALFNFSFLFNILLDVGITNFNNRSIAQNPDFLKENFSRIFSLKILLGGGYIIFMLILGIIAGYNIFQIKLLIPILFNQFLASFILYLRSNISGLLMFKTDSVLSVLDRFIMIIFCSILLWGNITKKPFQITWFIYTQTFAYLITCLIALGIVLKKTTLKNKFIDFSFFKSIFIQSIPFAMLHLFTSIHNRVDAVLLERMLPENGAYQAGIYASAFRLLDAGIIIAYLFSVILLPLFANMIANKKDVNQILKTSFTLLFIYGICVAAGCFFFHYELMDLLYYHHIAESANVFKILMITILPISLTYVFGSLLTANGNLKALNIIAISAVCLNLILNLILIPRFQAVGSAVTGLTTQTFIIIFELFIVIKIFRPKISWSYIFKLLGFTAGILAINYIAYVLLPFDWKINFLLMILFSIGMVFLFRLVKPKQILALLKSKEG